MKSYSAVCGFEGKGQAKNPDDITLLPIMKTDVTLRSRGRVLVIDTKYYKETLQTHLGKKTIHSQHLYQLLAYLRGTHKDCSDSLCEGILLYPVIDIQIDVSYKIQGYQVRIRALDLAKPWADVRRALLDLIDVPA
jgi:5-methylcytosine-specific restriction enzyme subunit McrC